MVNLINSLVWLGWHSKKEKKYVYGDRRAFRFSGGLRVICDGKGCIFELNFWRQKYFLGVFH